MKNFVVHFVSEMQKFMFAISVNFSTLCFLLIYLSMTHYSYVKQPNTERIFCTKLITYTIRLLLSCVTPSFFPKAVSSKPICGPFHNEHVFHLTSILLYVRSLSSRDEGASSGTKSKKYWTGFRDVFRTHSYLRQSNQQNQLTVLSV